MILYCMPLLLSTPSCNPRPAPAPGRHAHVRAESRGGWCDEDVRAAASRDAVALEDF